jgi:hypothetical protein
MGMARVSWASVKLAFVRPPGESILAASASGANTESADGTEVSGPVVGQTATTPLSAPTCGW